MPLPREPSEIHASSSPEPPKRAREILAKVDAPDHWKRFGMISGSTSLIGGGVGLLGYTHLEWLTPLLPDAAGVAMLLLGGGMALQHFPRGWLTLVSSNLSASNFSTFPLII